jgi:uncharacterized protein (UPF0210 family)
MPISKAHTYNNLNLKTMAKFKFLILLIISATLAACNQSVADPKTVADKYWQYLQTGNMIEAEKLLSTNSLSIFSEHTSRISSHTKLENSEAKTLVNTTITSLNPETGYSFTEKFSTVLVLQNGQWKIDISQSPIPSTAAATATAQEEKIQQLTEELSDSMQENIESIDNAMSEGMQMLNDALRDGSKEMGNSLLQLMNELNSTMQESIDKMKQRHEQQRQEQKQQHRQPSQPDPRQGEGMI